MRIGIDPVKQVIHPARNIVLQGLENQQELADRIEAALLQTLQLPQPIMPYIGFLTPERYGAIGDNISHPLSESYSTLVEAQVDYPAATSLDDEKDWCALEYCIAQARLTNTPVKGGGRYRLNKKWTLKRPDNIEYWDGATDQRPISIEINNIKTSVTSIGLEIFGSYVTDSIRIGHIEGPGIVAVGTPGAGAECIGILCEGEVDLKVGSISDFNFNMTLQNCYSSYIHLGYSFACRKGFYARKRPSDGAPNQENHIILGSIGGVYTSEAFTNDALRRSRSAELGIHLEAITGSFLNLGATQYCQMGATARALQIDTDTRANRIIVYLEGVRDDGDLCLCHGSDNEFMFDGLSSPSNVKVGKISIQGANNVIRGLNSRLSSAARVAFAPNSAASVIDIGPANRVEGKFVQQSIKAPSILRHNLVLDSNVFTIGGAGSVSAAITSGLPAFLDVIEAFDITCTGTDTVWWTSANIAVMSEIREWLKTGLAIKGVTNHAKIALYILNGATNALIGEGVTTGVESTTDWQFLQSIEKLPAGLANIKIRISVRNIVNGEVGCVVRCTKPMATFNINSQLRRCADVLPHDDIIQGRVIPNSIKAMQGISFEPHIVTDITSTQFITNSRAVAICTAHPTGSTVNGIINLVEDQPCTIINNSGSSISFTTTAMATAETLNDGQAMTVVRTTGKGAFASKVFRIG